MQTELHIITPSAKPWNIPKIAFHMLKIPCPLAIRWHILVQGADPDPKGMAKINACMAYLPAAGFIWTPSDDSLHHPNLIRRTGEIIAENPHVKAIVFSEERGPKEGNRILRAAPENLIPGAVDGSQYVLNRGFIGDKRFDWARHGQDADGWFIQELYQQEPGAFFFCDEVLAKFNSLEWL